jgi:hypothetical protein
MTPELIQQAVEHVDVQHRNRARSLSELVNKLLLKRRGSLPKNFEEWSQDFDVIKRTAEHVGACQAMNEMRLAVDPDSKLEEPPAMPKAAP